MPTVHQIGTDGPDTFEFATLAAFTARGRTVDGLSGYDTLKLDFALKFTDSLFTGLSNLESLSIAGGSGVSTITLGANANNAFLGGIDIASTAGPLTINAAAYNYALTVHGPLKSFMGGAGTANILADAASLAANGAKLTGGAGGIMLFSDGHGQWTDSLFGAMKNLTWFTAAQDDVLMLGSKAAAAFHNNIIIKADFVRGPSGEPIVDFAGANTAEHVGTRIDGHSLGTATRLFAETGFGGTFVGGKGYNEVSLLDGPNGVNAGSTTNIVLNGRATNVIDNLVADGTGHFFNIEIDGSIYGSEQQLIDHALYNPGTGQTVINLGHGGSLSFAGFVDIAQLHSQVGWIFH